MLSYSGLRNKKHYSFGDIEEWNGNTSIEKAPHKSVMTRHKIRVGEDNSLIEMVDDSGDRFQQYVNPYAKGVNQMVDVQYSNYGQTGKTQNSNGVIGGVAGSSGKLPYTILDKGAFRPPILRQEDLLPWSRMPRLAFSVDTMKVCNSATVDVQGGMDIDSMINSDPNTVYDVNANKSFAYDTSHDSYLDLEANLPKYGAESNKKSYPLSHPNVEVVLPDTLKTSATAVATSHYDHPQNISITMPDRLHAEASTGKKYAYYQQNITDDMINNIKLANPVGTNLELTKTYTTYTKPRDDANVSLRDTLLTSAESTKTYIYQNSSGGMVPTLDRKMPAHDYSTAHNSGPQKYTPQNYDITLDDRAVSGYGYTDRQTFR